MIRMSKLGLDARCQLENKYKGRWSFLQKQKKKKNSCLLAMLTEIREGGQENVGSINRTASEEPVFLKVSLGIENLTLGN
jgi:hypothetical protein